MLPATTRSRSLFPICFLGREGDELAVDQADPGAGDRALERQRSDRQAQLAAVIDQTSGSFSPSNAITLAMIWTSSR